MTGGVMISLMMSQPNSIVARRIVTTIITISAVTMIRSNFFKNVSIGLPQGLLGYFSPHGPLMTGHIHHYRLKHRFFKYSFVRRQSGSWKSNRLKQIRSLMGVRGEG
jgi:hypothetical protein